MYVPGQGTDASQINRKRFVAARFPSSHGLGGPMGSFPHQVQGPFVPGQVLGIALKDVVAVPGADSICLQPPVRDGVLPGQARRRPEAEGLAEALDARAELLGDADELKAGVRLAGEDVGRPQEVVLILMRASRQGASPR